MNRENDMKLVSSGEVEVNINMKTQENRKSSIERIENKAATKMIKKNIRFSDLKLNMSNKRNTTQSSLNQQ